MHTIFFITALFLTTASQAQLTTIIKWQNGRNSGRTDTIYYNPSQKLTWTDFRGRPDQQSIAAAITASGFGYNMSFQSKGNKAQLEIIVGCFFNKSKSWVKAGQASDYALNHEQHHFDITYIGACLFMQKLKSAKFTVDNYEQLAEELHEQTYAELQDMQNAYDGDTRNGRLEKVQFQWNQRIMNQLAAMAIN